jgi:hypothetical protein
VKDLAWLMFVSDFDKEARGFNGPRPTGKNTIAFCGYAVILLQVIGLLSAA